MSHLASYILLYAAFAIAATLVLRLFKVQTDWKIILTSTAVIFLGYCLASAYHMTRTFNAMTVFGVGDANTMAGGIAGALEHSQYGILLAPFAIALSIFLYKLWFRSPKA